MPADDGSLITLASLKGRVIVLYFYPKDDTSGCTAQAKDFSCMADQFTAAGAEVIGVSPDGVPSHKKFKEKHGLGIRLAADEDRAVANAYSWLPTRSSNKRRRSLSRTLTWRGLKLDIMVCFFAWPGSAFQTP